MRIFLVSFLFLLFSCSPGTRSFVVPDTNFKFQIPSDWVQLNSEEYNAAVKESQKILDLPQEYLDSIKAIQSDDDLNLYFFLKPQIIGTENIVTNFQILTMELHGQSLLLDEVIELQTGQVSKLPGISKVEIDRCPPMSFDAYRCYMVENNIIGRPPLQYIYILIDSGKLVTMTLTSSTANNLPELSSIISSIKR